MKLLLSTDEGEVIGIYNLKDVAGLNALTNPDVGELYNDVQVSTKPEPKPYGAEWRRQDGSVG